MADVLIGCTLDPESSIDQRSFGVLLWLLSTADIYRLSLKELYIFRSGAQLRHVHAGCWSFCAAIRGRQKAMGVWLAILRAVPSNS